MDWSAAHQKLRGLGLDCWAQPPGVPSMETHRPTPSASVLPAGQGFSPRRSGCFQAPDWILLRVGDRHEDRVRWRTTLLTRDKSEASGNTWTSFSYGWRMDKYLIVYPDGLLLTSMASVKYCVVGAPTSLMMTVMSTRIPAGKEILSLPEAFQCRNADRIEDKSGNICAVFMSCPISANIWPS